MEDIYQEEIIVKDDWRKASNPDILKSGGLGPCIAIGVYDPNTKTGYMVHIPGMSDENLSKFLEVVKNDYPNLDDLIVEAFGAGMDDCEDKEYHEYLKLDRKYVEKKLSKLFKNLVCDWLPNNCVGELILDTHTGEFDTEINGL
ncbi:hypothetical protein GOV06_05805 [Candidatus Woesearchaeota archaeon]|nr:hypothetical protein [Candidatus Woesearchaeota archaeon]